MTVFELRAIQERIKFDSPSMALCLGLDYEQYRRYYYGHSEIPMGIERAVKELEQINLTFIAELPNRVDEAADKEFPNGILSELSP